MKNSKRSRVRARRERDERAWTTKSSPVVVRLTEEATAYSPSVRNRRVRVGEWLPRGPGEPPRKRERKVPKSWIATRRGTCAKCGGPIRAGKDRVHYNTDQDLVHHRHPKPELKVEEPCTTCWLVHGGECDR